jgi:hypothetical protein
MLKKIKSLLKRNVGHVKDVDPFSVLPVCMEDICAQLVKHFSGEHYKWNEKERIKTLECLILSKFLMDHALIAAFHEKIEEIRIEFYLKMLDSIFESVLHKIFPDLEASDIVKNRLALYNNTLSENSHPRCWQLIAGTCTGIDYYSEQDLFTLTSSSLFLPQLLLYAQDSLKHVIKE